MNSPLQARIMESLSWGGPKSIDELAKELHAPRAVVRSHIADLAESKDVQGTPDHKVMVTS